MKRVLIVNSNSVNVNNATGITLRSVLSELETDSLMELYWNKTVAVTGAVNIKFKVLDFAPLSLAGLVFNNKGKEISGKMKNTAEQSAQSNRVLKNVFTYLRQFITLQADLSRVKLTKQDFEDINAFKPQVIYTLGGGVAALRLSYLLSKKLDLPIVVHFMDNWRHCIQWEDNPLLGHYKKTLKKYCNLCYSRSTECIAISPEMARVYTEETGVRHSALMNSVRVRDYLCSPRKKDGVYSFVYTGGLHLGRYKGLHIIGEVIENVAARKGVKTEFSIYTSPENIKAYSDNFKDLSNTRLIEAVPHSEIKQVFQNADFLVHTESEALVNNEFFKYSVSTKIPEYLASGRPTLFYGPQDIYLYKFLTDSQTAATADSEEKLSEVIEAMIDGKYDWLSERAVVYAKEKFDVTAAADIFSKAVDNVKIP